MKKALFMVVLIALNLSCKNEKSQNLEVISTEVKDISDTLKWSERMALSVMKRYPKAWNIDGKTETKWDYKIGMFCMALQKLYDETGNSLYFKYGEKYADTLINAQGEIKNYNLEDYNIDNINAGKILFDIYEKTKIEKYHLAIETLRSQLKTHLRTPSKGFWHKRIYPNQMWLDGLYMGEPFYARYNSTFEGGDRLNDIVLQFQLLHDHTKDQQTGLYYHAWDESKEMAWANKESGTAPNFWLRALGWYGMALVDVLDYMPEHHSGHQQLVGYLNELAEAVVKYQDKTGLWFQVPNMQEKTKNYLEASGSLMLIYTLAKGVKKGYLPLHFKMAANNGFNGVIKELISIDSDGELHINQVCKSAGLGGDPFRDGSFDYYMSEPVLTDNSHALGPFVLAALQLDL
ncbi:glycoside hydrolase family 88 protein [Aestuariibaculum sp. M13]|uniref:glycoside hydrolase family 88/105 protein n=1 Tax=Aestuariibaculum sp. M13 TaxID=2967132 RepID=UPI002159CC60|nr:glycoside hydrolase family 88 protein [Aestuariibaculum sp. M13]MCR8666831.1 glycoside hydrolase family 88 protein [Aestuariibaculum sp. M13]